MYAPSPSPRTSPRGRFSNEIVTSSPYSGLMRRRRPQVRTSNHVGPATLTATPRAACDPRGQSSGSTGRSHRGRGGSLRAGSRAVRCRHRSAQDNLKCRQSVSEPFQSPLLEHWRRDKCEGQNEETASAEFASDPSVRCFVPRRQRKGTFQRWLDGPAFIGHADDGKVRSPLQAMRVGYCFAHVTQTLPSQTRRRGHHESDQLSIGRCGADGNALSSGETEREHLPRLSARSRDIPDARYSRSIRADESSNAWPQFQWRSI